VEVFAVFLLQMEARRKRRSVEPSASPEMVSAGEAALAEGLGVTPAALRHLRERALAFFAASRFDKCLAVCDMLLELDDPYAGISFLSAACCERLGRRGEAGRHFRRGWDASSADPALRDDALVWGRHLLEEIAP
jgi:hypothetical protein